MNTIPLGYFLDQTTQNFRVHLKPSCFLMTAVLFGSLKCTITCKDKYCLLYSSDSFAHLFVIASVVKSYSQTSFFMSSHKKISCTLLLPRLHLQMSCKGIKCINQISQHGQRDLFTVFLIKFQVLDKLNVYIQSPWQRWKLFQRCCQHLGSVVLKYYFSFGVKKKIKKIMLFLVLLVVVVLS